MLYDEVQRLAGQEKWVEVPDGALRRRKDSWRAQGLPVHGADEALLLDITVRHGSDAIVFNVRLDDGHTKICRLCIRGWHEHQKGTHKHASRSHKCSARNLPHAEWLKHLDEVPYDDALKVWCSMVRVNLTPELALLWERMREVPTP